MDIRVQIESQIEILLWNIHGNRNCIEKLQITDGEGSRAPLLTENIQHDRKISINSSVFCQAASQMEIILTDSDNNKIGKPKTISLLTLSEEYQDKIVLAPRNDKILASCGKTLFLAKIFCRKTLKETTSLTIRRYLPLYENLLDWDIGQKMTGKYCSLVEEVEDQDLWTFIGPDLPDESVAEDQNQAPPPPSNNNCQNVLIYQISIFLLILIIISCNILLYFKIIKSKSPTVGPGAPDERPATSNVSIMRNSVPSRNVDLQSLRKRQGWISFIDLKNYFCFLSEDEMKIINDKSLNVIHRGKRASVNKSFSFDEKEV